MFLAAAWAHHLGILFREVAEERSKRRVTVGAQKINWGVAHVLVLTMLPQI
jgi:hypothetical protein